MTRQGKLTLKEGQAIAFDFDGVIHKYSKGWQDGSIYDSCNPEMLDLILILQSIKIPVFILSTRDPQQIKKWWDAQGFSIPCEIIEEGHTFFNNLKTIGITNKKLAAQLYIDDRAYQYKGQTVKEFLLDFIE